MSKIEEYLDKWFPPSDDPAYNMAKAKITNNLSMQYSYLIEHGYNHEEAEMEVLFFFGAKEGFQRALVNEHLLVKYTKFRRRYPKMIKSGIIALIILPFLVAFFFSGIETKVTALVAWVIAIFVVVTYIITIEYIDYHFQQRLAIKKQEDGFAYNDDALKEMVDILKGEKNEKNISNS